MNAQAQEKTGGNVARIDPKKSAIHTFADRLGVEPDKVMATLKATVFKAPGGRQVSDAEMMALLIVSNEYGLNPFTRELFAFPDKQNGIVPVVSVDGWSRIINEHRQLDGIAFAYSDDMTTPEGGQECPKWCECTIYRKDRAHPITVREYLDEVYRPPFQKDGRKIPGPWQSHTKRFLRHKTLIQASRIAFGFSGIYDEDEARRIVDGGTLQQGPDGSYATAPDAPPRPGAAMPPAEEETTLFPLVDFNGEVLGEFPGDAWIGNWLTHFQNAGDDANRQQFIDNNTETWDDLRVVGGFKSDDIARAVNGLKMARRTEPNKPRERAEESAPIDDAEDAAVATRMAPAAPTGTQQAGEESASPAKVDFDEAMEPKDLAGALADKVRACATAAELDAVKTANKTALEWLAEYGPNHHEMLGRVIDAKGAKVTP